MCAKVLIIEDDLAVVTLIKESCEKSGYEVDFSLEGEVGQHKALSYTYDLVILDVNLPGADGLRICRELRSKKSDLPILLVTSRAEEIDRVLGLEFGADDYITKPFSVRELLARIKAHLRKAELYQQRKAASPETTNLTYGQLLIDLSNRAVRYGGSLLELTSIEFEILSILATKPGKTVSRTELLEAIWGSDSPSNEPTLTTHLSRLRKKLEPDPTRPRFIKTVHGIGYCFVNQEGTFG